MNLTIDSFKEKVHRIACLGIIFSCIGIGNLYSIDLSIQTTLVLKESLDGYIEQQGSNEYLIQMKAHQTAIVRIERGTFELNKEINLLLTVSSPDGDIVDEVNTANDASFIIFDSSKAGQYKVLIRRWNGAAEGNYKIVLDYLKYTNSEPSQQIDLILNHFYNDNLPGSTINIRQDGQTLYKKSFGLANTEHKVAMTDSSLFDIGSVSKQIVAFSIAMLSEQGKLRLNESIISYLPEFPDYGKDISVLRLVLNIAGIRGYNQTIALSGYDEEEFDNITSRRVFDAILNHNSTYFNPGTQYRYSNSGYFLLTQIIENVVGISYHEWVKQNIFIPLEMNDSFVFETSSSMNRNITSSYKKKIEQHDYIKVNPQDYEVQLRNLGVRTVYTSSRDYIKWMENYSTGKVGGKEVLDQIELGIHDDPDSWNWAFGFAKTKFLGHNQKLSQGLIQGYRAYSSRFPDLNTNVIYLTNDGEYRTFYLANKIVEIALGHDTLEKNINSNYDFKNDFASETMSDTSEMHISKLSELQGVYYNTHLSKMFELKIENAKLRLKRFGEENTKLEIKSLSTILTDKWYMNKLEFHQSFDGNIESCKVYNSRDDDFIVFKKLIDN